MLESPLTEEQELMVEMETFLRASRPLATLIVVALAHGVDGGLIESLIGITQTAQDYLIYTHPEMSKLYLEHNTFNQESDADKLKNIAQQAVKIKVDILYGKAIDWKLKNQVAEEVLDRVYGKARQTVDVQNTIVNPDEALRKLNDQMEAQLKALGLKSVDELFLAEDGYEQE